MGVQWRAYRFDLALTVACAAGFAVWALWHWMKLWPELFGPGAGDVYFDADLSRVFLNLFLVERELRTSTHPLFATLIVLPVRALQAILGLRAVAMLPVVIGGLAAALGGFSFGCLRANGFSRRESLVFTLLCASSGSFVIFLPVVESFVTGAATIVLCASLVGGSRERSAWVGGACLALCYGITITNAVIGLLAIFFTYSSWRKRMIAACIGMAAIGILTLVQWSPAFPLRAERRPLTEESKYLRPLELGGAASVIRSFFLDSVVLPVPRDGSFPNVKEDPAFPTGCLTFRGSRLVASPGAAVALAGWLAMFICGAYVLATRPELKRIAGFLASAIGFNLLLHLAYGYETFLFSPHWAPLLVLVAAFSARLPRPAWLSALAVALIAVIGALNELQASVARDLIRLPGPPSTGKPADPPFALYFIDLSKPIGELDGARLELSMPGDHGRSFIAREGTRNATAGVARPLAGTRPALLIAPLPGGAGTIGSIAKDGSRLLVNYNWLVRLPERSEVSLGDETRGPFFANRWRAGDFELSRRFPSGRGYAVIELDPTLPVKGCVVDTLALFDATKLCNEPFLR